MLVTETSKSDIKALYVSFTTIMGCHFRKLLFINEG